MTDATDMTDATETNTARTEERLARMVLLRACEPGDPRVAAEVDRQGAVAVAKDIVTGRSGLRGAAAMRGRLPDGAHDLDSAASGDLQAARLCDARLVIPGDPEWPSQVDDLGARAPLALWVRGEGNLRLLMIRSVSIVGARAATSYGLTIARQVAAELADRGWLVLSGGAFGIDAAAHQGALDAGGASGCVLAGGVDNAYPRSHESLLARISDHGVVISEAAMGSAALRPRFLARNRVIAALTRGTVVVEAAARSGSRTTAREAADLVRPVMAFPGPVTSPMSTGCHDLLRDQQAVLVTGADDVEELISGLSERPTVERPVVDPVSAEGRVLEALPARRGVDLERLSASTNLDPTEVIVALGLLESAGLAQRSGAGWRRAAA